MQRIALVLAAATVAGVGIAATNAVSPAATPALHAIAVPATPAVHSNDAQICHLLATLANYGASAKHMDHFTQLLDQSTRHRLSSSSTYSQNFGSKLDGLIGQFSTTWKAKYGSAFSASAAQAAMGKAFVSLEISTAAKSPKLAAMVAGDLGPAAMAHGKAVSPLRGDETIAMADIKADGSLPELHVALACKSGGSWRVIADRSLTADKLRTNLDAQLTEMTAPRAQWPAKESDAYCQVAHRVLMAVQDRPAR